MAISGPNDHGECFNVASAGAQLKAAPETYAPKLLDAGLADDLLPDFEGWMSTAPFSGHLVGLQIRDRFAETMAREAGRTGYTRQAVNHRIRTVEIDGRTLREAADYPVASLAVLPTDLVDEFATVAASSSRKIGAGRKPIAPSAGSPLPNSTPIATGAE